MRNADPLILGGVVKERETSTISEFSRLAYKDIGKAREHEVDASPRIEYNAVFLGKSIRDRYTKTAVGPLLTRYFFFRSRTGPNGH